MRKLIFLLALFGAEASAQSFELTGCQPQDGVLSCPVYNSGDKAFSSIRYAVVAIEDGRSFPWAEATGEVEIPGGLEPGETVHTNFPLPSLPERAEGREIKYNASATPLTLAWLDDAAKIAMCWNVGSLSRDALDEVIVIRFSVDARGVPDGMAFDAEGSDGPAARQAFEAARRAIIRCGAGGGLEGGAVEFSVTAGIRKIE